MITYQQRKLLDFIVRFQEETRGVSPSYDEMSAALGLHSKSGIHRLIKGLIDRGMLRQIPKKSRCLEVVAVPKLPAAETIAQEIVRSLDDARRLATTPETAVDEVAVVASVIERTMGEAPSLN